MPFSVEEVRSWVSGRVVNEKAIGSRLKEISVQASASLSQSRDQDIAFFFDPRLRDELIDAAPGVLITADAFIPPLEKAGLPLWNRAAVITSPDPHSAMAAVSRQMARSQSQHSHIEQPTKTQIHPTAVVASDAHLGRNVVVGAYVVVEAGATIGDEVVLYPHVYVGPNAEVGRRSVLFSGVKLYENVQLGEGARLHAGVVLGADGFGFAPAKENGKVVGHQKIFHLGRVRVGRDVEIGANSCIDRGTFSDTVIGDYCKIDNQVQIGHNCQIGDGTVICGSAGLAGSVKTGKFVYIGGHTGVNNKVNIGDGAMLGGYSVAVQDVPAGEKLWGVPGRLGRQTFRLQVMLDRMLKAKKSGKKHERSPDTH